MSSEPNIERLSAIAAEAYPDLTIKEIKRLLSEAQDRKRKGTGYVLISPNDGRRLEIEPLVLE